MTPATRLPRKIHKNGFLCTWYVLVNKPDTPQKTKQNNNYKKTATEKITTIKEKTSESKYTKIITVTFMIQNIINNNNNNNRHHVKATISMIK